MPTIRFAGRTIECQVGDNLRTVLMGAGAPLYASPMGALHCRGFGTCGTCAVGVEGEVTPDTSMERWRLSVKPHRADSGLRLACQCRVRGDLRVTKYGGRWGQKVDEAPVHTPDAEG